jgi:hypothetical protein
MKRSDRMPLTEAWVMEYKGNRIIQGYRKHFDISVDCAVQELGLLGFTFTKAVIKTEKAGSPTQAESRLKKGAAPGFGERKQTSLPADLIKGGGDRSLICLFCNRIQGLIIKEQDKSNP